MSWIEIVLIAVGLSVDSFVASATGGAIMQRQYKRILVKMPVVFALCQGVMTAFGYFVGRGMSDLIRSFDHWVAFGLLFFLGSKMVYGRLKGGEAEKASFDPTSKRVLLGLGIATSIDAAAIGISLAILNTSIIQTSAVITLTTLLFSAAGVIVGGKLGSKFDSKVLEIVGGIVLIGIGVKILCEHLISNC